jgi:hypothetical protein
MARSGREIYLCGTPGCGIIFVRAEIPGAECPYTFDDEPLPAYILQQSVKFSSSQVIGGDVSARLSISAARELSNEQIVTESGRNSLELVPHPRERSANLRARDATGGGPWSYKCPRILSPGHRFLRAILATGESRR